MCGVRERVVVSGRSRGGFAERAEDPGSGTRLRGSRRAGGSSGDRRAREGGNCVRTKAVVVVAASEGGLDGGCGAWAWLLESEVRFGGGHGLWGASLASRATSSRGGQKRWMSTIKRP